MFKKIISLIASSMILSGALNISASAAAPVYFEGITTNVFEQNFSDISSTAEASGFAFSGSWKCTGEFVILPGTANGSIKTKNNIDLTGAYGYEFSSEAIMTQNKANLYLAYNTADSSGYKVVISRGDSLVSLYRAGDDTALTTASATVGYGTPEVWTAKLEGQKLTISQDGTAVLEYTDANAPGLNGIFGIESGANNNFAVFNMKLDKLGNGVTVNNWRYEKDFSSKDTKDGLASDGITISSTNNSTISYSDSYLSIPSPGGNTNIYYNKKLSGDFTIETQIATHYANGFTIRFNRDAAGNYYALKYVSSKTGAVADNFKLIKYTVKTSSAAAATKTLASASTTTNTNVKCVISIKDNEESINVTASILNTSGVLQKTLTHDIAKSELFEETHRLRIHAASAGDYVRWYYFNVYSTPSGETKTRDVNVFNKSFGTGDTVESLSQLGLKMRSDNLPDSITTATNKYPHYGSVKDGMYWSNSKPYPYLYYDQEVSGDLTFEGTTKVYMNDVAYQVYRSADGKNQYAVSVSKNGVKIVKTVNGTDTETVSSPLTKSDGVTVTTGSFIGYGNKTTVKVTNNEDGTLTIQADTVAPSTGVKGTCTYTDTSGAPLKSGICRIAFGHNGSYRMLYDMKITKHENYVDNGEFEGKFYVDGEEEICYEKGEISFEMPVADFGTYNVIAALYEDNEMTGIKTFTPREMYEGKVKLFDTTESSAATGEVKVYLIDAIGTLNKTMNVWTLR